MSDKIDDEGYRANVGIVLVNQSGKLLWARRKGRRGWQFPQGGIHADESAEQAMYRELKEEIGLNPEDVNILGRTDGWLKYNLPKRYQRLNNIIPVIGQKQRWFLLELKVDDQKIDLADSDSPEFDRWRWVNYWYPVTNVIFFKQLVYQRALKQLYRFVPNRDKISPDAPEVDEESRYGDFLLREKDKRNRKKSKKESRDNKATKKTTKQNKSNSNTIEKNQSESTNNKSNKEKSKKGQRRRHSFPRRVGQRVKKSVNQIAGYVEKQTAVNEEDE